MFNARCLFGFYFCSCHTQTHTTWLWKVQKKLKTKKRKQKKGAKEARKRRCKNCHKTFMETQRQGRTEEGQGQGLGERQTLVAHVAGGDTCHRLLHAAFLLPAACCGGSHFICLLIKSCDTYKCPSGVNTFACMSSASQPPLPPPSPPILHSLPTHLHCLQYQWMSRTSENLRLNVQCTARPATCDSTSSLPLSLSFALSPSYFFTLSFRRACWKCTENLSLYSVLPVTLGPLLPITPSIPAQRPVWSLL